MEKLGIGVIGLGMGMYTLDINRQKELNPVLESFTAFEDRLREGMEVRGICATKKEKLARVAKEYNIPFTTTDYRELLDKDDIHIIGVYSPDHLHALHSIDALKAGKHVICTKPMVTTLDECEQVVKAVDETGKKFLVGQTSRFTQMFIQAKRIYDNGDLGDLIFAEASYVHDLRALFKTKPWWRQKPQKDFLLGGGCHPIDLLRWFMGDIEEVHAYGRCGNLVPGYTREDNFLINLKFKNGGLARVLAAYDLVKPPLPGLTLGLYGTKGSLLNDTLILDTDEGPKQQKIELPEEEFFDHSGQVMLYMKHLEYCIINDKEPLVNARDGAQVVAACLASWESIRTGKPVRITNYELRITN